MFELSVSRGFSKSGAALKVTVSTAVVSPKSAVTADAADVIVAVSLVEAVPSITKVVSPEASTVMFAAVVDAPLA